VGVIPDAAPVLVLAGLVVNLPMDLVCERLEVAAVAAGPVARGRNPLGVPSRSRIGRTRDGLRLRSEQH
jgi:hypothetical protein